jgi:pyruvate-formate lyase
MLPQVARIVIINTTNSSGASLETMAGKNRVLITATRSGSEVNDTIFYEHFLAGLQDLASDEDKDKKVSLWEAFKFASDGVERYYKDQGRLATEHPMLSDNGLEAINTTAKDAPVLARYTVLNVDRVASTTNPRLQTLLEERREIELKMAELRLSERTMKPEEFEKQLQELILALAQKTAEIRAQEKK